MIRLRAVGATEIEIDGRRLASRSGVAFALAAYLCIRAGERLARSDLATLFWPDSEESRGRHNLRQTLYRLRQDGFALEENAEEVFVDAAFVDSDVRQVLDPRWPDQDSELVIGSEAAFLPRLRRDISEQFRCWLDSTSALITAQVARKALRRIELARQEGRWTEMVTLADAVLRVDPLNEEATLAKAEYFAMTGAKSTAVQLIDAYVAELGPHASQIALPASVLRRRISERTSNWGPRSARETPLVGREEIIGRLTRLIASASEGRGSGVILTGAPGVGKSRLALEMRAIAELRGFRCVEVRVDPANSSRPFGLASTLASILRDLPGAAGSSPQALAIARRLTLTGGTGLPLDVDDSRDLSAAQLIWALVELMSAISAETRLLLTVDDLHNADAGSVDLLCSIVAVSQSLRVAVLMTSRPAAPGIHSPIDTSAIGVRIAIPPLEAEASRALATLLGGNLSEPLTEGAIQIMVAAAGGNPLFLRELATCRDPFERKGAVPPSLLLLIESRLSQLPAEHLRTLRLSSTLGSYASVRRLRLLARTSGDSFPLSTVLEDLERDGILAGARGGALIVHDCWRVCIERGMSPATAAAIALESAECLMGDARDTDPADLHWFAAELYSTAGCDSDARQCLLSAGNVLLSKGLARQAVAAFERALAHSRDDADRILLLDHVAKAHSSSGDHEAAARRAEEGLSLAKFGSASCAGIRVQLLSTLSEASWRMGAPHNDALNELAQALELADVPHGIRHSACLTGIRLVYNDRASPLGERFDAVLAETTSAFGPTLPGALGRLIFAVECGTASEVRERCESLRQVSLHEHPASMRARSFRYRAAAFRFIGEVELARQSYLDALEISQSAGELIEAHECVAHLAFLALDWDDPCGAARWVERCREITTSTPPFFQKRQSWNLVGRFLLQRGQFAECLVAYQPAVAELRADTMSRRQIADTACIGLAAAYADEGTLADDMMAITARAIEEDRPNQQHDFPAEAHARYLRWQHSDRESRSWASEYLGRRLSQYNRPIPTSFSLLRFFDRTRTSTAETVEQSSWLIQNR